MKTITKQILAGLQEKNIVLAEDENSVIWLLGVQDIVEQDQDRTKLLKAIGDLAKKQPNDQQFGTQVRKLINFFEEQQTTRNHEVSKNKE